MKDVSVVLPVYNAFEEATACLHSVLEHREGIRRVLIMDDCSPNGSFEQYAIAQGVSSGCIEFHRNDTNLGFPSNCNRGIEMAGEDDVVLLNSDTVVTPNWVKKLKKAAYSSNDIASVTPLTNNGDICSVPRFGVPNEVPAGFSLLGFSSLIEEVAQHQYEELPTFVGFCVYLRRDALLQCGSFDSESFGRGYGEDNDLACRFRQAGLRNILDDSTYVFHHGNESFGTMREELSVEATRVLNKRHPHYFDSVSVFCNRNPLRQIHLRILDEMAMRASKHAPGRILHILQNGPVAERRGPLGGTELHVRDIIQLTREQASHWSLVPTKRCYYLTAHLPEQDREYILDLGKTSLESILRPEFFGFVHLHHSRYFDHMELTRALIKHGSYAVSFHDYILACPRFHLYTPFRKVCNGHECSESCGYSKEYIQEYRETTTEMLERAARLICFSDSTRNYVDSILGRKFKWTKIHHGILGGGRLAERTLNPCRDKPKGDQALKVLFLGYVPQHKGSLIIEELLNTNELEGTKIEWHILGKFFGNASGRLKDHGEYTRETLANKLEEISPHLVMILSICPETYCLTLDEAWNAGIPVITTPLGAPAERMRESGAGWILAELSATAVVKQVSDILKNWSTYSTAYQALGNTEVRSIEAETSDYAQMYQFALQEASKNSGEHLFHYLKDFGLEHSPPVGFLGTLVGEVVNKSIWILDSFHLRAYVQKFVNSLLPARVIRELKSLR